MNNHNHAPDIASIAHPGHRKLSDETLEKIETYTMANLAPKQIQQLLLQEKPDLLVTSRDISNARNKIHNIELGDLTPTQALILALEKYNDAPEAAKTAEVQVISILKAKEAFLSDLPGSDRSSCFK